MKNLPYWLSLAFCGWASHAFAQTEVDALRYSETQFGGSARILGVGGANTAVGADIGNISSNPAGLGLFQQSEVSLTLGYATDNSNGQYNGVGSKFGDTRNSLHVGGFGIVFANRRPDSDNGSDWRAGTFAIGMSRINDFNRNFRYSGTTNDQQSLFQRLREPQVSNKNISDQEAAQQYDNLDGLAYGAYLTNLNPNGTVPRPNTAIQQQERVTATGGQSQYTFAYGASYRDRLYLGGGIGVVNTRFDETRDFTEADANNAVSLDLYDRVQTRGTGFNLRVGAIYRATDYVRLGASVQSPTWSRLTDTYSTQLNTTFTPPLTLVDDNGNVLSSIPSGAANIPISNYSYSVTTPFRANGGVAVLLGKYGFLSGDLEYVNYNQARLNSNSSSGDNYSFANENQAVRNLYQSALNLKLGAEARYDIFRARLGYAHYGDPYKTNDFNRSQSYYTAGLGLRQSSFFLDVAGVYNTSNRYYSPYTIIDKKDGNMQPVISVDANRFTASVTAGVTF